MMAKRKAARRAKARKKGRKGAASHRSVKRPTMEAKASWRKGRKAGARKKLAPKKRGARKGATARAKAPGLDRARRRLEETVPTPPSSLNMRRRGSAARTGRAELEESLREHGAMSPAITGGDVDADWENAYFSGDEAPGGDNPTPDQDIVEDIGKALGVKYEDNEELKGSDKVVERDKHRWEMDPASSEDYKDRK
jgi:hypothetical protein